MWKDDRNLGTVIIGFRQKRIGPGRVLEIQTIIQLTVRILNYRAKSIKKNNLFLPFLGPL